MFRSILRLTSQKLVPLETYRVTRKGWGFRDDCAKLIISFFVLFWLPPTINMFLSFPNHLLWQAISQLQPIDIFKSPLCYNPVIRLNIEPPIFRKIVKINCKKKPVNGLNYRTVFSKFYYFAENKSLGGIRQPNFFRIHFLITHL